MRTDPDPDPAHDPAPDPLIDVLVQSAFTVTAVLTRVGADNDLSLTQFRVLAILRDRRMRMATLADYLGLERSTLSGLIERSERRGLAARAPSVTDRRSVEVFLTPAGLALATRLAGEVERALAPLTVRLPSAERGRLQSLLERMHPSDGAEDEG